MTIRIARASVFLFPVNLIIFEDSLCTFFQLFPLAASTNVRSRPKVVVSVSAIFDVRPESQRMLGLRPGTRTA